MACMVHGFKTYRHCGLIRVSRASGCCFTLISSRDRGLKWGRNRSNVIGYVEDLCQPARLAHIASSLNHELDCAFLSFSITKRRLWIVPISLRRINCNVIDCCFYLGRVIHWLAKLLFPKGHFDFIAHSWWFTKLEYVGTSSKEESFFWRKAPITESNLTRN